MSSVIQSRADLVDEELYPSEDGQPMAETSFHVDCITLLKQALEDHLEAREDVYVAVDMFWYWEEGNSKARLAPDVMVIPGVERKGRRSFLSFEENGAIPSVIFEIASHGTWRENVNEKRAAYERLGVSEYFVFDPEAKYLKPALRGFRLQNGTYQELSRAFDGGMISEELNLRMVPDFGELLLTDLQNGHRILPRREGLRRAEMQIQLDNNLAETLKLEIIQAKEETANAIEEVAKAKEGEARAKEAEAKAKEAEAKAKEETAEKDAELNRLKAQLEAILKKSD